MGLGGAGSEHGDQRLHGLGELAPTPLRALRQPSDLARRLQPAIGVVGLDELERALDGRGRGVCSLQRAVGLWVGVRAVALGGALHRRKSRDPKYQSGVSKEEKRKVGVALSNSHKRREGGGWSVSLFLFFLFILSFFSTASLFLSYLTCLAVVATCWSCRSVKNI